MSWSVLLEPSAITINRDDRQRKELTGIEELAESIRRFGQLQPIVIQRGTNVLIAGERRLTAIQSLWDEAEADPEIAAEKALPLVRCVYSDEVDPIELKALEYEENAKRKDLPWKDACEAMLVYHELKQAQSADWQYQDTAEVFNIAAPTATKYISIARALRANNTLVVEAPKLETAWNIVKRQNERKAASEVNEIMNLTKAVIAVPKAETTEGESGEASSLESEIFTVLSSTTATGFILNEDFQFWAKTYDGHPFNLIHCDFPYGVGMHKSDQGSGSAYGTYEDTPEIYWALIDTLLNYLDNFCAESAHLLFWFSMDFYQETLDALSTKFKVNPFPLIWHKTDNSGILPDPNRGPRRIYETAFLASRGDRKIVRPVGNVVGSPIQRGRHMSEKPQAVLGHFFRMLVDEHSAVLDPTCGSGSAIRAAVTAGASRYLGLEINTEFADHADEVLREHLEELDNA